MDKYIIRSYTYLRSLQEQEEEKVIDETLFKICESDDDCTYCCNDLLNKVSTGSFYCKP